MTTVRSHTSNLDQPRSVYPTCRCAGCAQVPVEPNGTGETADWCEHHLLIVRTGRAQTVGTTQIGRPGRKRAKTQAVCGTESGYRAHLRNHTSTCPACREAHNYYAKQARKNEGNT